MCQFATHFERRGCGYCAQAAKVGSAAESRVKASVRPAVQVPYCLAHLCGHAAPRLKKLPGRAAKGHEALGKVDPQHVQSQKRCMAAVKGMLLDIPLRQLGAPGCSVNIKQRGQVMGTSFGR